METLTLKLEGSDKFQVQEAYRFIRTNIQFCGSEIKTIAITSCNENEGKSTVSLYLAKTFAELGKRVLFIDADMRKSVLAGRNLKVQNAIGLSELLSGQERDINNCLYRMDVNNLYIMFAGNYPPNPSELLSGTYFESILTAARASFDYVIIDTPPLGTVTDAAIIAARCDGTVMVVGQDKVNRAEAMDVVQQLRSSGTKLLGIIRNNTGDKSGKYYYRRGRYGYYSRYGYYRKSGYGYGKGYGYGYGKRSGYGYGSTGKKS